jgi:hypothetical protein
MEDARGEHKEPAAILMLAASERLSTDHLAVVDEELRRAPVGAANYRQQAGELFASNQAQCAAFGARQHGPIGVIFLSHATGILQHEDGAGKHLFRDPLA